MKSHGDHPGAGGLLRVAALDAFASNASRTCTTFEQLTLPLTLNASSCGLEPAGTPAGSGPPKPPNTLSLPQSLRAEALAIVGAAESADTAASATAAVTNLRIGASCLGCARADAAHCKESWLCPRKCSHSCDLSERTAGRSRLGRSPSAPANGRETLAYAGGAEVCRAVAGTTATRGMKMHLEGCCWGPTVVGS